MREKRYIEIGKRLAKLRGGLSQTDFAKKNGMSLRAYQYYEDGERVPKMPLLKQLAGAHLVTVDWILTGVEDIEGARLAEGMKRFGIVAKLIAQVEASLTREEKVIYKGVMAKAVVEGAENLAVVEERQFLAWLRRWLDGQRSYDASTDPQLHLILKQVAAAWKDPKNREVLRELLGGVVEIIRSEDETTKAALRMNVVAFRQSVARGQQLGILSKKAEQKAEGE